MQSSNGVRPGVVALAGAVMALTVFGVIRSASHRSDESLEAVAERVVDVAAAASSGVSRGGAARAGDRAAATRLDARGEAARSSRDGSDRRVGEPGRSEAGGARPLGVDPAIAREVDREAEQKAREEANELLRSPELQDRLDGVWALSEVAPEEARAEAERLLDSSVSEGSRWDVYDRLIDLAETDAGKIDVALRALGDPDAEARDQAAYWLSTEDADRHPQILDALRRAYEAEGDPDARASIESALESQDLDFVPRELSELDLGDVESEIQ